MIPEIAFTHIGTQRREATNAYTERLPGDRLSFNLYAIHSDGNVVSTPQEAVVQKQVGEGFVGKVYLLESKPYVLKTTTPGAFQHELRLTSSGVRPHPAEANEQYVQALSVSMRLIHASVPRLSEEIMGTRVETPRSYGYTHLPTGLALAVERVDGRGPRFDLPVNEASNLLKTRNGLLDLGTELGLEHVGQIHPNNPLGQPNIWITDNGYMWVDAVAAFPLKGNVLGIPFRFHNDMKARFAEDATFNRIHTDRFDMMIQKYRHLFSDHELASLQGDLALYRELDDSLGSHPQPRRNPGQLISADIAAAKQIGKTLVSFPVKAGYDQARTTALNLVSSEARHRNINKQALQGPESAYEEGLLTTAEIESIRASIEDPKSLPADVQRQIKILERLFLVHVAPTMASNALEAYTYIAPLALGSDPKIAAYGFLGGRVATPLLRLMSTALTGIVWKTEVKTALLSMIPLIGAYKGVPWQIATLKGGREEIAHWNAREINAKASYLLSPLGGGLGSDADRRMWPHVGRRVEKFLKWLGRTEKHYGNLAPPETLTTHVQE